MRKDKLDRTACHLDYLKIGRKLHSDEWNYSRRNVQLTDFFMDGKPDGKMLWHYARWLEQTENHSLLEGCYGISLCRAHRHIGYSTDEYSVDPNGIKNIDPAVLENAKRGRCYVYTPLLSREDVVRVLDSNHPVTIGLAISKEWYDPIDGEIPDSEPNTEITGSHSIAVIEYNHSTKRFIFVNSWGEDWGQRGWGSFSDAYFDQHAEECYLIPLPAKIPYPSESGIIRLGWKWSFENFLSVHCREIVDADQNARIGWAFCAKRNDYLEVDELFVWPGYRKKGYGRVLTNMVLELARDMRLPIRTRVPFADTETCFITGVEAITKKFGLRLVESQDSWCHLNGIAHESKELLSLNKKRPRRAASPLEWLRPQNEKPIVSPTTIPILYGTNRAPQYYKDDLIAFSTQRGSELNLGCVSVQIPIFQRFGGVGNRWKLWVDSWKQWLTLINSIEINDMRLKSFTENGFGEFIEFLLSQKQYKSPRNLLYVHGFNNTFEDAARQAGQLASDLKVLGNTYLFSWPSAGKKSSYSADEATVSAAFPYFRDFLDLIRSKSTSVPLTIICHSMGNRLITKYLEHESMHVHHKYKPLHNVIFAAPDVDSDEFRQALLASASKVRKCTLYATRADLALQLSEVLHSYPRAGLFPPYIVQDGLDTILVEGFNVFDLAHGYFSQAGNTLHDMYNLFHLDSDPDMRPATKKRFTDDGKSFWAIPAT